MTADLFPSDFFKLRPRPEEWTQDLEWLWLERLAAAKLEADKPNAKKIWARRKERCRHVIVEANFDLVAIMTASQAPNPDDPLHDAVESEAQYLLLLSVDEFDLSRSNHDRVAGGDKKATIFRHFATRRMRNRIIDIFRRRDRNREIPTDPRTSRDSLRATSPLDIADTRTVESNVTEMREYMQSILDSACLSDNERQVIHFRYFHDPILTLKEVGEKISLTKARVQQIEVAVLAKLRHEIESPKKREREKIEMRHLVMQALNDPDTRLDGEERSILRLRFLVEPGHTVQEIAQLLGLHYNTVASAIKGATKKLRAA